MKKILKTVLAAVCMAGLVASSSAIQITYADRGVGQWSPGNEYNDSTDSGVLAGVIRSVNIWNGDASAGLYTVGNDSATFTKGGGTLVPIDLNLPIAYVNRVQEAGLVGWTGLDNTGGLFQYITAKYGNVTQQVFYIGDLLETGITVPSDIPGTKGSGLSHVSWLSGTRVNTPDGGSMLVLLGGAVTVLGFLRRKISA